MEESGGVFNQWEIETRLGGKFETKLFSDNQFTQFDLSKNYFIFLYFFKNLIFDKKMSDLNSEVIGGRSLRNRKSLAAKNKGKKKDFKKSCV